VKRYLHFRFQRVIAYDFELAVEIGVWGFLVSRCFERDMDFEARTCFWFRHLGFVGAFHNASSDDFKIVTLARDVENAFFPLGRLDIEVQRTRAKL